MPPGDSYNHALIANVRPPSWINPTPSGRYNLVVVGAGTAGLVSAAGAAGLGAKVALVEKQSLGGDCLNHGCVPSKGLLRAARAVHAMKEAHRFGVRIRGSIEADFGAAMERMRRLRADISHHDSAHRLRGLGVDVYLGDARFVAPDAVDVGCHTLKFSRAVIATGARASFPPIPGLASSGYLTNETVFSLTTLPARLIVIGAGPIGCELAQAFRRFGSEVTIVSLDPRLLPGEDPDASATLEAQLAREGVVMALGAKVLRVEHRGQERVVVFDQGSGPRRVAGEEIFVAVGRTPNVEGLDLGAGGVAFDGAGVTVNDRLQTSNPRVFAAGDVCSPYKFTHAADAMARIALENALFFGRKKSSALVIPRATYTDPEVAHVGLTAEQARERGLTIATYSVPLAENDRAVLDGESDGFGRIHVSRPSGRIVGATLVASHAGELIGEVALAMTAGLSIGALGRTVHPYPTQSEVWKRLADAHNRTRLTPRVGGLIERYLKWRR